MIPYNPKNWLKLIFNFHSSQLMKNMLPNLLGIGGLTAGMVWFFSDVVAVKIPEGVSIHAFVGLVLGLVLVFRTNTAYDRWWEGRRLFGSLTNSSRNLAIKLTAILPADDHDARRFFAQAIPNFYFALKEHLRDGVKFEQLQLEGLENATELTQAKHVPAHIATLLQKRLTRMLNEGVIRGSQYRTLSDDLNVFIDVAGACERILRTPIPISYSIFIKQVIIIYLLTMPFSMISNLGYYTVPLVMFTTYVLAGIELLAEEIEDPFGTDPNDLDTDGMAKGIRTLVQDILEFEISKPGPSQDPSETESLED
jgi:ion channel-forming bestrophin family protein